MLGEKRLPNTLVRLIEPFVSRTSGNFRDQKNDQKNGNGNGKYPDILSLSYIEKSALSMVIFLRNTCICGTSELRYQLNLICNAGINLQNEILQIQNQNFQQNEYSVNRENRENPISEKLNGRNLEGEFENQNLNQNQNQINYQSQLNKGNKGNQRRKDTINVSRFISACTAVRAAVSMASQPSLRRLMVAGGKGE